MAKPNRFIILKMRYRAGKLTSPMLQWELKENYGLLDLQTNMFAPFAGGKNHFILKNAFKECNESNHQEGYKFISLDL